MGCAICPTVSKSSHIKRQIDTILSCNGYVPSTTKHCICLKIELQHCLHPIIHQNLKQVPSLYSFIENYNIYINYIKSTYSLLESSENYFKFLTHSVCLDSSINNSIKVLLISIFSTNKGLLSVKIVEGLPFIKLDEKDLSQSTLKMYKAWIAYCNVTEEILQPKDSTMDLTECEKRLTEMLRDYTMHKECFAFIDFNLYLEFLKSTIGLAKFLVNKAKKIILAFKNYFFTFKFIERKIRLLGFKAWSIGVDNGKEIVHLLLKVD